MKIWYFLNAIPYNEDDEDRFYYKDKKSFTNYINSLRPQLLSGYKISGIDYDYQVLTVSMPVLNGTSVRKINYLKIERPDGNYTRDYYYWITDYEFVGRNDVKLYLSLDYYNTYYWDFMETLGGGGHVKVLRNHTDRFTKNSDGSLSPIFSLESDINNIDANLADAPKEIIKIEQHKLITKFAGTVRNTHGVGGGYGGIFNISSYIDRFIVFTNAAIDAPYVSSTELVNVSRTGGVKTIMKFGEPLTAPPDLTNSYVSTPKVIAPNSGEPYAYLFKSSETEKTASGYGVKLFPFEQDVNKSLIGRISNCVNPKFNYKIPPIYSEDGCTVKPVSLEPASFVDIDPYHYVGAGNTITVTLTPNTFPFKVVLEKDGAEHSIPSNAVAFRFKHLNGTEFGQPMLLIDWTGTLKKITVQFRQRNPSDSYSQVVPHVFLNPVYETLDKNTFDIKEWNDKSYGFFQESKTVTNEDYNFYNSKPTVSQLTGSYKFWLEPQLSISALTRDLEYNGNSFSIPANVFQKYSIYLKQYQGINFVIDEINLLNSQSSNREILNNANVSFKSTYDNTLPSITDTFNSYLATSKSQMLNSYLTASGSLNYDKQIAKQSNAIASQNVGKNVIGAITGGSAAVGGAMAFGGVTGGVLAAPSAVWNGVGTIASSVLERERTKTQNAKTVFNSQQAVKQIESKARDLYNAPDTLNKGSVDLLSIWESNNVRNTIIEKRENTNNEMTIYIKHALPSIPKLEEMAAQTFLYGYPSNRYKQINHSTIMTRRHFVFLQVERISLGVPSTWQPDRQWNQKITNYFDKLFNRGVRLHWSDDPISIKNYFWSNNAELSIWPRAITLSKNNDTNLIVRDNIK